MAADGAVLRNNGAVDREITIWTAGQTLAGSGEAFIGLSCQTSRFEMRLELGTRSLWCLYSIKLARPRVICSKFFSSMSLSHTHNTHRRAHLVLNKPVAGSNK